MKAFRYRNAGQWYKGNTHLHTTLSDGRKTVAEVAGMYAAQGYQFLCRTDHWVASDVAAEPGGSPVLWLDGIELDGTDYTRCLYHVVCLGRFQGLQRGMGLLPALELCRAQGGLLILAHPHWTGNSTDDALRHGFHAVEVYNHVCHWLNGKSNGAYAWDAMAERAPGTLGFAADDAHLTPAHPGWNGGWVMVNAADCSRDALMAAIRAGDFYASCGPEYQAIESDGATVTIHTSPVQFARLIGPVWLGMRTGSFDGTLLTEARFTIPPDWVYARLEIEDAQGRCAWSNPLFVETA